MKSLITLVFFLIFNLAIVSCDEGGSKKSQRKGSGPGQNVQDPNFCPSAELSEEQKEHIKNLFDERDFKNLGKEERKTAQTKLYQKILEEVAKTEEQQTALSRCFEQRRRQSPNKRKSSS